MELAIYLPLVFVLQDLFVGSVQGNCVKQDFRPQMQLFAMLNTCL